MMFRLLTALTVLASSLASTAQFRPRDRFPITSDQVAAKIIATFAQKGVALDASQITLPAAITATEDMPALEVRSVEKLGVLKGNDAETNSSAVKLACSKAKICLPFYVVVTLSGFPTGRAASQPQAIVSIGKFAREETVIKSGAHLKMLVDNGTMHIQMAVISLQNGSLNQQIKVRSADHKQTYPVQVIDANTVRGAL